MSVKEIIAQMTLEEKAGICSGKDFWRTKAVERLGVPSVMVCDGPHGLRKQDGEGDHVGVNDSITAVCFPTACLTACSFDREMMREMGATLGRECQAEEITVLLGPAVNIKRSPLCGRNFEYVSEDPYLTGELSASFIAGVQSENVGVSIKHFAANNQERERMSASSEVDERTLREIYLAGFETAIRKSKPWTVMCSYNRINGVFASENEWLMTKILREEWGFDGYVVTDWGAVADRVKGLAAGVDLEMPSSAGENDIEIVKAVREGSLDEAVLDRAVERILTVHNRYLENKKGGTFDREADHKKAIAIAKSCMVLLKNDGALPLRQKEEGVAFIGGFARTPRFQGGGSSHIRAYRVDSALDAAKKYADVVYAEGFSAEKDETDDTLIAEAVALAKRSKKAVIFAGLPDLFESEGYDREHMRLPDCQNKLIEEVLKVQPNVVVVLHNGSPVEMPWANRVSAILEAYLGGEGVGEATADVLFGAANPGGKLAESFPLRVEDNPSYLQFPGTGGKAHYTEGVFVGYRYYDSRDMEVLFPFGHGLSYASFALSNLRLSKAAMTEGETIQVTVDVTNTGSRAGSEVVQLYVHDATGAAVRPEKELKGFARAELSPGETKTVAMELGTRSFAWYSGELGWYAKTGEYQLLVGNSSRNITLAETVHYTSKTAPAFAVDENSIVGDLLANPKTRDYTLEKIVPRMGGFQSEEPEWATLMERMLHDMPLRAARSFHGLTNAEIAGYVADLNKLL